MLEEVGVQMAHFPHDYAFDVGLYENDERIENVMWVLLVIRCHFVVRLKENVILTFVLWNA